MPPYVPRFADTKAIIRDVAEILRPPRRIPISDAARQYVRVNMPGGYVGPWDPEITPYMVEPMDMLASRQHEGLVFVGPAQSGKTQALIEGWISYAVVCDPSDMMVVQTSQETARDFSRRRIDRMHRNSPEIGGRLSPYRNDDNTHDKFYRAGNILTIAWPSINQLSGRSIRFMALTDYDRMPEDIDGEGDPFGLSVKRTQTFMSGGMTLAESSPGWEITNRKWESTEPHEAPPSRGILSLYNRGDRRRWYWPCPDCGEYFEPGPGLSRFNIPEGGNDLVARAESTVMVCPHCGSAIEQQHKRTMNTAGVWVPAGQRVTSDGELIGEPRRAPIASYWLHGAAAAFQPWKSLILKHLEAEREYERTGSEQALKTTVNVDQGSPYLPKKHASDRSSHELEVRAEDLPKRQVPEGVRFLTAAIDVQKNRFVVQVQGWGIGLECWVVDRYNLHWSARKNSEGEPYPINPAGYAEDWEILLEKVVDRRYPLGDGSKRTMPILLAACDSGGLTGVTAKAYEFWRRVRSMGFGRKFILVKGDGRLEAPRIKETWPDSTSRKDRRANARGMVPVYALNVNRLKDGIDADLSRTDRGPGYVHFPDWLGPWFYAELTAEERETKGWVKPRRVNNEAFDLMVYNRACVIRLDGETVDWERPPAWAKEWADNPRVVEQGEEGRATRPVKTRPAPAPRSWVSPDMSFGSDDWNL